MSLTRESLRLSYDQRALQHQSALELVADLIRAKEALARPKDLLAAQELRGILEQSK